MRRLRTTRVVLPSRTKVPLAQPAVRSEASGDDEFRLGRGFACASIALAPAPLLFVQRDNAQTGELAKEASAAVTCGTSCVRYVVKWEWDWNEAGGGHASARFDDVLESCELADLVVHRLLHHGRH
jgi:hypothetical protein